MGRARRARFRRGGTLEADFQAAVTTDATVNGWTWYHTHDSRHSPAGFPDLVLIRGARIIVAEVKVGANTTTEAQRDWLSVFAGVSETVLWRSEPAPRAELWRGIVETAAPLSGDNRIGADFGEIGIRLARPAPGVDLHAYDARIAARMLPEAVQRALLADVLRVQEAARRHRED